jgi:hypothetical protein
VTPITTVVLADTEEALQQAAKVANEATGDDIVVTRTFRSFPGGVERLKVEKYRFWDYFDEVELIPGDITSFLIVFHVTPGAGSFWKDLVIGVLETIRERVPGARASIGRDSFSL